jgi:hypothetical protein
MNERSSCYIFCFLFIILHPSFRFASLAARQVEDAALPSYGYARMKSGEQLLHALTDAR